MVNCFLKYDRRVCCFFVSFLLCFIKVEMTLIMLNLSTPLDLSLVLYFPPLKFLLDEEHCNYVVVFVHFLKHLLSVCKLVIIEELNVLHKAIYFLYTDVFYECYLSVDASHEIIFLLRFFHLCTISDKELLDFSLITFVILSLLTDKLN
uniref:Uncharacterized protein n=1 Tax=Trichobilharzia regenti TaxID=157069 RepID=A0AA85KJ80_TRIRE|nr:unnamed protein product [Trichobilharzia regenti]